VTSLEFAKFLHFDFLFQIIFFALEVMIFLLKLVTLPYYINYSYFVVDFVFLIFLAACQFIKLQIGKTGNKSEDKDSLVWFLFLCGPIALLLVFYIYF